MSTQSHTEIRREWYTPRYPILLSEADLAAINQGCSVVEAVAEGSDPAAVFAFTSDAAEVARNLSSLIVRTSEARRKAVA